MYNLEENNLNNASQRQEIPKGRLQQLLVTTITNYYIYRDSKAESPLALEAGKICKPSAAT
jgi:hypothetical protein